MQRRSLFLAAPLLIGLPFAALACPPAAQAQAAPVYTAQAPVVVAPVVTSAQVINFKMTREQCRHLSKADGYTQDEFAARSIWCDKSYASNNFKDSEHPIDDGMMPYAEPAAGPAIPIE